MSLLDNVLGAATQALGQGSGNSGASLLPLLTQLLSQGEGLQGLVQKLSAGGLGEQLQSWLSSGANLPVSGAQLSSALGGAGGLLGQLAQAAGVSPDQAGEQLSQILPQVIDHLSPEGQLPNNGPIDLSSLSGLSGLLGGLLK